jgi:hypothetical protein
VEKLPPEEREVIDLRFSHGWTEVEIVGTLSHLYCIENRD